MNQLKELSLWEESDVTALPSTEFDWLEFKGSAKFVAPGWEVDLSKYLSAWANYDGGYLIFGVADPLPGQPFQIDGGVPVDSKPDLPTWLDQVLPNLVDPPLPKISTHLIMGKEAGSKIKPAHALIVIHVPPSDSAPHQARDHKYYQRLGRNNQPLRHRAILDIHARIKHAKIKTTLIVHIGNTKPTLFWKLENIGAVMARHWDAAIEFPTRIGKTEIRIKDVDRINKNGPDGSYWNVRVFSPHHPPLFPGSDASGIYELVPVGNSNDPKSRSEIRVTIFADGMPPQREVFQLKDVIREH
jgi:hypothetical protein